MKDKDKTKEQLMQELDCMRQELAELKRSAAGGWFQAFADLLPEVIFEIDPEGRITFSNARGFQLSGYTPEDLSNGLYVHDMFIPEDRDSGGKNIARIMAGEDVGVTEYTVRRKDGSTVPVMVHTVPIVHEDKVTGLRGILVDITERKKMEHRLRIKKIAIESSINAIAISDLEANLTYVNDSFVRMWGYDDDQEVLGKDVRGFWEQKKEAQEVVVALREKGIWIGELSAKRKDGSTFDVHLSTSVVKDDAGVPICLMASFIDISKRKEMEKTLTRENEKFHAMMEQSPLGVTLNDEKGHYKYINPKFVEMFGYTREEIPTGREWFRKAFPDENYRMHVIETWIADLKQFKQGEPWSRTFTVRCKDGSEKIVHFRPVALGTGEQLTIYEDITETLEEMNAALRVLLKKREEDKKELEEEVLFNVKELVLPFLVKLKKSPLNPKQATYVSILESNLNDIVSSYSHSLSSTYLGLTPTEIQVTSLIREGRTTKEIADVMNLSPRTIDTHRDNIRRKMGIKNKKANLRSHLLYLQQYG